MPRGDEPTIREVDDALWAELAPLLEADKTRKKAGAPRKADRGIVNVLAWLARTGG